MFLVFGLPTIRFSKPHSAAFPIRPMRSASEEDFVPVAQEDWRLLVVEILDGDGMEWL